MAAKRSTTTTTTTTAAAVLLPPSSRRRRHRHRRPRPSEDDEEKNAVEKEDDAKNPTTTVKTNATKNATTTRVCVKNVPPSFDESKLADHFRSDGGGGKGGAKKKDLIVTDCKLMKTKGGKRRNFAFVGFKDPEMASHVVDRFHGTYALTSKLTVEFAFSKTDAPVAHRPWSRHSVGSSRHARRREEEEEAASSKKRRRSEEGGKGEERGKRTGGKDDDDDDGGKRRSGRRKDGTAASSRDSAHGSDDVEDEDVRRRKEAFLAAMTGRPRGSSSSGGGGKVKGGKLWANDDDFVPAAAQEEEEDRSGSSSSSSSSSDDDDDDDDESGSDSEDSMGAGADALLASRSRDAAPQPRAHGSAMSDMEYLRSKVVRAGDGDLDDGESESDEEEDDEGEEEGDVDDGEASVESGDDGSSSAPSSSGGDDDDESDDDSDDDDDDARRGRSQGGTPEGGAPPANSDAQKGEEQSGNNVAAAVVGDRLFVRNLPFAATESELRSHFESLANLGTVTECHVPVDDRNRSKGFGFVKFSSREDAIAAMDASDGRDFQGRILRVHPARPERDGNNADFNPNDDEAESSTYKRKQELQKKASASNVAAGWSASHVRGDAVLDTLASRLGITKGDVLDVKDAGKTSGGDAAVRLALAEARIVEENRIYFRERGIDVEALVSFGGKKGGEGGGRSTTKRSTTSILIKNLPSETTKEELTKLFHRAGCAEPKKILLPPSRTVAVAEYDRPIDAKRAFRRVAFKRLRHVPVYLEWAPLGCRISSAGGDGNDDDDGGRPDEVDAAAAKEEEQREGEEREEGETEETNTTTSSRTVYVKNLNFSTTEDRLLKAFEDKLGSASGVRAARIPTETAAVKKTATTGDHREEAKLAMSMSMGYGFVEFGSDDDARRAIRAANGSIVDGHSLELKFSSSGGGGVDAAARRSLAKKKGRTKLMVRNVPFQATRLDIVKLFGSFGHLKKVRLPKKFDGSHRGFAFVEYATATEASDASHALSRTHLYGRHLVLEWAKEEEEEEGREGDEGKTTGKRDRPSSSSRRRDDETETKPKNKKIRF